MKSIKLRIKSVQSTMQITKAMELVASSKLRHAKERVERGRPYFNIMHQTLTDIAYSNTEFSSPYIVKREVKKRCYVVIAGDRGLAGGYNSNLFKKALAHMEGTPACVVPIGKKAVEYYTRRCTELYCTDYPVAEEVSVSDCYELARRLSASFAAGEFDELHLVYTNFVSMLSQEPAVMQVLPIHYEKEYAKERSRTGGLLLYDPGCEAVYDAIVPEYIAGMIYGALGESWASELGARRTAMDAASKNAGDMIDSLSLRYNRARQGAITQEITEIVAGAGS